MARYDPPDKVWIIIQTLLPEPATPRIGRSWAEHRKSSTACSGAPYAIYLSDMAYGKRFTIDLTDGSSLVLLTLFSTSSFHYLV